MREGCAGAVSSSGCCVIALMLVAALAACAAPTEPGTDPDIDKWPYRLSPNGVRVQGTSRILVILAQFADGAPAPITQAAMRERLFGNPGLLTETYRIASGNSFTLRGDVTPWYRSTVTVAASRTTGVLTASGEWDYVIDAMLAAEHDVDYGLYDNDGPDGKPNSGDDDGLVDGGIVVVNSELNLFCNGGTGRGPHPHTVPRWKVDGLPVSTHDARTGGGFIAVGGYIVISATGCSTTGNATPSIAHELGHLLFGLPDLYQSFGSAVFTPWEVRRWVVGCWDLMAAGSGWGCGSGTPAYDGRIGTFGAWTRATIGWVQPTVIPADKDRTYDLYSLGHGGTVLRLPIRDNEYLLLEYREPGAGDGLPPAAGLLVYHVADTLPIFPPTNPAKWSRLNLIEADDDSAMVRTEREGGNRGARGDAFGGSRTTLRPGEHSRFTAIDGSPLSFELLGITLSPTEHRARVRVAPVNP